MKPHPTTQLAPTDRDPPCGMREHGPAIKLLTTQEVADRLGVSRATVRTYLARGQFTCYIKVKNGHHLVLASEVDDIVEPLPNEWRWADVEAAMWRREVERAASNTRGEV